MSNSLIEELLSEDIDSLFCKLGEEIEPTSFGIAPLDYKQLIEAGKEWLQNNKKTLSTIICCNPKIESFISGDDSFDRRIELVTVLVDIISEKYANIPVLTVSVILVREGIYVLCKK